MTVVHVRLRKLNLCVVCPKLEMYRRRLYIQQTDDVVFIIRGKARAKRECM